MHPRIFQTVLLQWLRFRQNPNGRWCSVSASVFSHSSAAPSPLHRKCTVTVCLFSLRFSLFCILPGNIIHPLIFFIVSVNGRKLNHFIQIQQEINDHDRCSDRNRRIKEIQDKRNLCGKRNCGQGILVQRTDH